MYVLAVAASAYWTIYPARIPAGIYLADLMAYSDCTFKNEAVVDDGRPDLDRIAKALAEKCGDEYRKWLVVVTAGGKSMGVLSNYDMALMTVEMTRRAGARRANRN